MKARHELRHGTRAAHPAWVLACALGLGACGTAGAAPVPAASVPAVAVGVPLFAKVEGDATGVGLAWWAVKGAVQYEVRRATDPQGTVSVRSTLPSGTLGYRDTLPANPAAWFQLVAIGADGARSAGAWTLVNTPSVGAVDIGPTGAVIRWTTIQPAPAGLEIWRSADPQRPAARVGSVASGTTTFTDPKPLGGTSYYQVVALGGGARAASSWTAAAAAQAGSGPIAPVAAVVTPPSAVPGGPSTGSSKLAGGNTSMPSTHANVQPFATAQGSAPPPSLALAQTGVNPATVGGGPKAPPASTSAAKAVPPISNFHVVSTSAVSHQARWDVAADEVACANPGTTTPTANYGYDLYLKGPKDPGYTELGAAQSLSFGCGYVLVTNPGGVDATAFYYPQGPFTSYVEAGTGFRLIRKDPAGVLLQVTADYTYGAPPPLEPASLTASEPTYGEIDLSWPAVPDATGYNVSEKGSTAPPAHVTSPNAVLKSVVPGSHTYQVAAAYAVPTPTLTLPEATITAHAVVPAHGGTYLTAGAGPGNAAFATLHLASHGYQPGQRFFDLVNQLGLVTGWDTYDVPITASPEAFAQYGNVTELGFGRTVGCWRFTGGSPPSPLTVCLAGNHGAPMTPTQPIDAASIAASVGVNPSSMAMILTSPTRGLLFATLVPSGTIDDPDPTRFMTPSWGQGWQLGATATYDSEGPKAAPHACLACHGGTFNMTNGEVSGATLLPIDPGLLAFGPSGWVARAANEEAIRAINAMVAASNPSPAVADYISGLYGGKVAVAGTAARTPYVPAAWAAQDQIFRMVVQPNCLMCHLATPAPLSFAAANAFLQNKAAVYAAVCKTHTMPNAETAFKNFWTSETAVGSTNVSLAGYLIASLGYASCP